MNPWNRRDALGALAFFLLLLSVMALGNWLGDVLTTAAAHLPHL